MMTSEERIEQLFSLLTTWRGFPNYQLERRADIFFAIYLKDIHRHCYPNNEFDLIIPEFPLRYGSVRADDQGIGSNRSAKVDYACVDRTNEFCVLLELKTEERSLRRGQMKNMEDAAKAGYGALRSGIRELFDHTKEKQKYTTLLDYLDSEPPAHTSAMAGRTLEPPLGGMVIALIKPTADRAFCPRDCRVISFDDVGAAVQREPGQKDQFTQSFLNALLSWKEPIGR